MGLRFWGGTWGNTAELALAGQPRGACVISHPPARLDVLRPHTVPDGVSLGQHPGRGGDGDRGV